MERDEVPIEKIDITIKDYQTENKVDKTITSIYPQLFEIPYLEQQVKELKEYRME